MTVHELSAARFNKMIREVERTEGFAAACAACTRIATDPEQYGLESMLRAKHRLGRLLLVGHPATTTELGIDEMTAEPAMS
jgi:hypothetical protein